MTYYRLLDPKNKGVIVRAEGRIHQEYVPGRGWMDSGIMLQYFWPDSPLYEAYDEIPESEALKAITKE